MLVTKRIFPNFLKSLSFLLLIGLFAGLSACVNTDEGFSNQAEIDDGLIQQHLTDNNITAEKSANGYYYRVIAENPQGQDIQAGDIVSIYYDLSLLDGTLLEKIERGSDPPAHILHGQGLVIPQGIDFALTEMKSGEKYEFFLPSQFAYNSYFYKQLIPQFALVRMVIEVDAIVSEAGQKSYEDGLINAYINDQDLTDVQPKEDGLYYQLLTTGEGELAQSLQRITVHYTGKLLDGTVFDTSVGKTPFDFVLGQNTVIQGWEKGLLLMKKGETARLIIPSHLAYGPNLFVVPQVIGEDLVNTQNVAPYPFDIPPYSPLVFDVEVLEIE
ncbi:FKBP-type peptidyl-prolyl cis-trans isomerase [Fulvivirgaceae bacterium BMA10]|uniref:peptidylprolyl isomerase n=1 Tax=Splendidivirga corallicola TaxID=3051826 RepID=A0ABT8KPP0_9BACT|nr:FKBP-type peptidyl-prolyl cis-trans isomerase [Fulvivirgaceae bacterium BMA10]